MIYSTFRDIELSSLGLGNMRLPKLNPDDPDSKIDRHKAHELMARAMEAGINYYDTAYVYGDGDSELCLGEGMKQFDRSSFHYATKFNIRATTDYEMVFETQLKRLQTDYIDFYLLHCLQTDNIEGYMHGGAIEYFEKQREKGRIRYLGFSTHAPTDLLERFVNHHNWDFAQIQLNWFDWHYGKAREEYRILTEHNIPIIVMEPVRGGKLASLNEKAEAILRKVRPDWSISSWAMRFVRSLPGIKVVLSGMNSLEQLEDNVNTFSDPLTLTDSDREALEEACRAYASEIFVPCTACRYCTKTCPSRIEIPAYMKLYNDYKVRGNNALKQAGSIVSAGTPADCIGCGTCMPHCPQDIKIPQILAELSKLL